MFKVLGEPKLTPQQMAHFKNLELFIDARGELEIDPSAVLGFRVAIFTKAHLPNARGLLRNSKVVIGKDAFIGSYSILYNCMIGEGATVSVGSVVRSRVVPAYTLVEGNPVKVIANFNREKKVWEYLETPKDL